MLFQVSFLLLVPFTELVVPDTSGPFKTFVAQVRRVEQFVVALLTDRASFKKYLKTTVYSLTLNDFNTPYVIYSCVVSQMIHSPDITPDLSKNMRSNLKRLADLFSISNTKAYRNALAVCSEPRFPVGSIWVGDMTSLDEFSTTLNGMIDFAKLSGCTASSRRWSAYAPPHHQGPEGPRLPHAPPRVGRLSLRPGAATPSCIVNVQ